jgi:hypothetical protein
MYGVLKDLLVITTLFQACVLFGHRLTRWLSQYIRNDTPSPHCSVRSAYLFAGENPI